MKKISKKKKLIRLLIILAITITAALLLYLFMNNKNEQIIAKANGQKIYESEIKERLKEVLQNTDSTPFQLEKLPKEILEVLVKDIFVQKELDKRVKKSKLARNKEIKSKIDEYTKKITRKEYLDSIIKERINDSAIKDKYVELVNELSGKKELRLRHILLKTKNEARKIIKKAKSGNSFNKLASKYSLDESTSKNGGDLGYVLESNLTKEFASVAASMKSGAVSSPIKTDYGWHVIKIDDIRNAEIMPFESIKATIETQLKEAEIKNIFTEIVDSVKIEILIDLIPANTDQSPEKTL